MDNRTPAKQAPIGQQPWTVEAAAVGRTIAEGRRALGLTQEDMARRLGVTKAAVSKWEQAASLPDISLLPGIASLLDLTVDELLGWDPQLSEDEIAELILRLREDFARDASGTFVRAKRVATSHWTCWKALAGIASEMLYAACAMTRKPTGNDDAAGTETAPETADLARAMLDEGVAICEHIEHDSGDAAMANLAVSTHAAAMIHRKDDPRAIIAFVEPFMPPTAPLGGKPGLASLYVMAGDREHAGKLARESMVEAIAELNMATSLWFAEEPEPEQIVACADAFANVVAAYAPIHGGEELRVVAPTMRFSAAAALVGTGALDMALDQLVRTVDELEAIDASALAGSPGFEGSPAVLARAICEPKAWGALADDPRYQSLVERLRGRFG